MPCEIPCTQYDSWQDFKNRIGELSESDNIVKRRRYAFRGQGDAKWSLQSTFDRLYGHLDMTLRRNAAVALLDIFADELRETGLLGQRREPDAAMVDTTWAMARHHGLPTRLLDWSYSPYIAAFFAYSDVVIKDLDVEMVGIWRIDSQHILWQGDVGASVLRMASDDNPRMSQQRGCFTLLRSSHTTLDDFVAETATDDRAMQKLELPAHDACVAIRDLDLMGINHSALFPDATGAALTALLRVGITLRSGNRRFADRRKTDATVVTSALDDTAGVDSELGA